MAVHQPMQHSVQQSYPEMVPRRTARAWPGWLAFVLALGAAGAFIWLWHRPLLATNAELRKSLDEAQARNAKLSKELREAQAAAQGLRQERDDLSNEHARVLKEKEEAIEALNRLKDELSSKLQVEVQSGDIAITRRGNELVVDVSDKILFDTGQTELKEQGRKVLMQVAGTLVRFKDRVIQVGGHTDSARVVSPELRERYPTNWELSTARATNVVRFLQERTKIPGERLAAAGFAEYRPAATNRNEEGRQRNRRIEIVLIPRPPKT